MQGTIGRDSFEAKTSCFGTIETPPSAAPTKLGADLLEYPSDITVESILQAQSQSIVKGLFGPGQIGIIYGEPTAGKTFALINMSYHVALGRPWAGRRTKQTAVLYVCLEGVPGFKKRMVAAVGQLGDPGKFFARLKVPVFMSSKNPEHTKQSVALVIAAVEKLKADSRASQVMVAIDTLANAMAGDDENSAADIGNFLTRYVGSIITATGAGVMIAHHPNKEGDIRGSTALEGNVDCVIRASRGKPDNADCKPDDKVGKAKKDGKAKSQRKSSDLRTLYAEKVKDGEEGPLLAYKLVPVSLGTDSDGDPVTSCVVEPITQSADERARECLKVTADLMQSAIRSGLSLSPSSHTPKGKDGVEKYAARWLVQNYRSDRNFSEDDFAKALADNLNFSLEIEKYGSKGKKKRPERYKLKGEPFPDSSPPVRKADSSAGSPTDGPETGGTQ